jgi:hypothetical protein
LFFVKEFAVGKGVARYFGSVVVATAASNTAVNIAATKHAESSVELQTSVTGKLRTGGLISRTAREPTANGGPHFPLWIKLPPKDLPLSLSSRRRLYHRLPPKVAANQHI